MSNFPQGRQSQSYSDVTDRCFCAAVTVVQLLSIGSFGDGNTRLIGLVTKKSLTMPRAMSGCVCKIGDRLSKYQDFQIQSGLKI